MLLLPLRSRVLVPFLLLASSTALPADDDDGHLNPWVDSVRGIVTPEWCKTIIAEAENLGFPLDTDSIDRGELVNKYSQQIDILNQGGIVEEESLWNLIEPIMPRLTNMVQTMKEKVWDLERARAKVPDFEWIFLRKYSPTSDRNMLKIHQDSNMFTVNIFLNDDYEGGGLFYVRPPAALGTMENTSIPEVPEEWKPYDWLANVKRENTTITRFPDLKQGDALIHNYTVWHAIAPLEKGSKYSLLFFFDMDNPEIQQHFDPPVVVTFINFFTEGTIDLMWVDPWSASFEENLVEPAMEVGKEYRVGTNARHIWRAYQRESGALVEEFTVELGRENPYEISKPFDIECTFINLALNGTIDLMWVNQGTDPETEELIEGDMVLGEKLNILCEVGIIFRAIRREDKALITEFRVEADRVVPYKIIDTVDGREKLHHEYEEDLADAEL